MLGVTNTYIRCDKKDCKYNYRGYCYPPKDDRDNKILIITDGKCNTYIHGSK